jgi:hypothetical protein
MRGEDEMNEHNVAALRDLIDEWRTREGGQDLPEFLAGRGVLASSALTDDDGVAIAADAGAAPTKDRGEIGLWMRQRLDQIARGVRALVGGVWLGLT